MSNIDGRTTFNFQGPWRAVYRKGPDTGWSVVNALGDKVCQGGHSMFDERDFPLIAAAPDLLAAGKLVLDSAQSISAEQTEAFGAMYAAIAKATGEGTK